MIAAFKRRKEQERGIHMLQVQYNREEILSVIDKVARKTLAMDLTWEWPCGVAYYGVSRAYQTTGNQDYLDQLVKWVDEYIELGLPAFTVNTCAMGHMLITLYEETGDQKYWDIVLSKIGYIRGARCGSGIRCCSIRSRYPMTSRSRPGRIRCSWRRSSCCVWAASWRIRS